MNKFLITIFITLIIYPQAFSETKLKIPHQLKHFVEKLESEKNTLQGGAIAILYKGQVVYKTTFGNQKGKAGSITSTTLFPLASVSKAVSAIAIALMVDQKILNFEDTYRLSYLKNPISLVNILSHSTGYKFSGNFQIEQGMTRQKLLNTLQKQQASCQPGQCYLYSNTTFSLLDEVLKSKNLSLEDALSNLRNSLKTEEIQIFSKDPKANLAYPHSNKTINEVIIKKPLPFPPYYPKTTPASAGIFASLDGMIELFKLGFGYRPDLISKPTLDRIYTPIKSNDDIFKWHLKWPIDEKAIKSYYALGWRVLRVKDHPNKELIFHSGYISGVSTFIGFVPSEEIGMIVLINQDSHFADEKGIDLWHQLLSS